MQADQHTTQKRPQVLIEIKHGKTGGEGPNICLSSQIHEWKVWRSRGQLKRTSTHNNDKMTKHGPKKDINKRSHQLYGGKRNLRNLLKLARNWSQWWCQSC